MSDTPRLDALQATGDDTYYQLCNLIGELERELAAAVVGITDTHKWIPVSEQSPGDEQRVLGYYPDVDDPQGSAETLTYYAADAPDGPEAWHDHCGSATDAPTHWKPWKAPK